METSIFQGKNIGKLPLTHCGSLYLFPEYSNIGLKGLRRFEDFVNAWGSYDPSISIIAGTIEKGREKAINHLQWVAACSKDLEKISEEFLMPVRIFNETVTRKVKMKHPNDVNGFADVYKEVKTTKLTSGKTMLSIERILDVKAGSFYSFKYVDFGVNSIYYIKMK